MNILLIGERYSDNIGDPILCKTVESEIKNLFPYANTFWCDISGRTNYSKDKRNISLKLRIYLFLKKIMYSFSFGRKLFNSTFKKKEKKKITNINLTNQNYDLAIFVGGQLFKDTFIESISFFIENLKLRNIPVIFHACGIGYLGGKENKQKLLNAINSSIVKSISIRESKNYFDKFVEINNIVPLFKETFDPAINVSRYFTYNSKKENVIGLGIMYSKEYSKKLQKRMWKQIIEYLNNEKIEWNIFINGNKFDLEFCEELVSEMAINNKKIYCTHNVNEYLNLINSFRMMISMRLHSHIVAYSLGVPSIAISWDDKVREFFLKCKNEKYCFPMCNLDKVFFNTIDSLYNLNSCYFESKKEILDFQQNYQIDLLKKDILKITGEENRIV